MDCNYIDAELYSFENYNINHSSFDYINYRYNYHCYFYCYGDDSVNKYTPEADISPYPTVVKKFCISFSPSLLKLIVSYC